MATDKPRSHHKRPIAEKEAPRDVEQDAHLTQEEFAAQMHLLTERARAAGLNPIHTLAQTYIKQGMAIVGSLLVALENENSPKKKEK